MLQTPCCYCEEPVSVIHHHKLTILSAHRKSLCFAFVQFQTYERKVAGFKFPQENEIKALISNNMQQLIFTFAGTFHMFVKGNQLIHQMNLEANQFPFALHFHTGGVTFWGYYPQIHLHCLQMNLTVVLTYHFACTWCLA